jgi:BirA family transcriptional regulator, biotin operon repressor / biotin---[acetyl-CoA-carboxylase] ligase
LKSLRSDPLSPELVEALARVKPRLGAIGSPVVFYQTTSSTNDRALDLASEGALVLADAQTAGRGRRGHTWFSPVGSGLYVSVVLAPGRARVDPARATKLLTLTAGLAVAEGIEAATGLRAHVKWPNDLYVGPRKIAGILAEASGSPAKLVVVGFGINVQRTAFPPDLRDRATSVESELDRQVDRLLVLAETLSAMASRYADLLDARYDAILDAWRRRAPSAAGARVSWTSARRTLSGVTAGIDSDGALMVETEGGIERIVAGELQWETWER